MKLLIFALIALLPLIDAQVALAAETLPGSEPSQQGRPLAYWLAALDSSRLSSAQPKHAEAEEAIHSLGPEAIPLILRYRVGNRHQRIALIRHACAILEPEGDLKLVEALSDTDATVRETALEVLPKTTMPAALDDIVRLLADPVRSVRAAAVLAMVRLAPEREETIAALVEALHNTPSIPAADTLELSREDAALTLGTLGPKAKAAIPELTMLLTDSDDDAREAAAVALWKIEHNAAVAPVLVERLENARDYQTCVRVLKALGDMGPLAKSAVAVITRKIDDPGVSFVPQTVDLPQLAVDALAEIDPIAASEAKKKLRAD
jgi:hypothetical protein